MSVLEISVTMKMSTVKFKREPKAKKEMISIGITNLFIGS